MVEFPSFSCFGLIRVFFEKCKKGRLGGSVGRPPLVFSSGLDLRVVYSSHAVGPTLGSEPT